MSTMTSFRWIPVAMLALSGVACSNYLTSGDTSRDPNRPTVATNNQLFVGVQSNTWALYGSDLSRIAAMLDQQAIYGNAQYQVIYTYSITENTTNGQHSAFYAAGGLVDIRTLQKQAAAQHDSLFWGIGQIQEAMLMSLAADVFGDLVYSQALQGGNPLLDKQVDIFNALLAKLDSGITNVNTASATNVGPGASDLNYGGSAAQWTALAHSLRARIYLHLAKLDPSNYANVLTESRLGISDPTGASDYQAVFSGNANETNLLFQFTVEQRSGYILPNPRFVNFAKDTLSNDPRLSDFVDPVDSTQYAAAFIDPTAPQKIVSFDENTLMRAEAAYRTGATIEALAQLNAYRTAHGIPTPVVLGSALLKAILAEKYVALFHQVEAWSDYKRNCYPNLIPVVAGQTIPARLKYDTNERQTNPNIPTASAQPARNQNDPAAATDPFGNTCLGQ